MTMRAIAITSGGGRRDHLKFSAAGRISAGLVAAFWSTRPPNMRRTLVLTVNPILSQSGAGISCNMGYAGVITPSQSTHLNRRLSSKS
jgi:hypothetical protein